MGLKEKLENNLLVVVVACVVAAAGVTWAAAEKIRIAPKDDDIARLRQSLDSCNQELAKAKANANAPPTNRATPGEDCADKILKAIELLKSRTTARLKQSDVDTVRQAVKGLDQDRITKVRSHIPNRDWSGVAEDLVSPFNKERESMARLILRYFPIALNEIGAKDLAPPEIEIVWPRAN